MIELLAPAGDLEKLKTAVKYGADAVYFGGNFSLRAAAGNFTIEEIEEGIDYIDATYFLKNSRGSWDKLTESYSKKIFTHNEIEESVKKVGLTLVKRVINDKIAGKRFVYLLKK